MDRKEKILIIAEGERAEADFFKQLSAVFGVRFQICCFKANISFKSWHDVDHIFYFITII